MRSTPTSQTEHQPKIPARDLGSETDGEKSAWLRSVFEDYQRILLAYAMRMTGGKRERAEEAVQETFLRLCRETPDSLQDHLRAWLFKVCRSRVIDMHRTDHSTIPIAREGGAQREQVVARQVDADSPALLCQRSEEAKRLRELVEQLPERQRELLHLKIHGQLSYREMAEATGISVSNVGFLLHQAMRTLREKLAGDEAFC